MTISVLSLLVEASFGGKTDKRVIEGAIDLLLFSDNFVEVGPQHVPEMGSNHNHVVFIEVRGSRLSLAAAQSE